MLETARRSLLLALPLLASTASIALPQGSSKEDGPALRAALQAILEDAALADAPPSVDLRPLMPPIGRQTMNDCAAWAFGYYARSYVEARNQEWTPDQPWLRFSPSFIYNQVNGGKDEGSNPIKVLELLRDRGAATLSTFPYAARDFLKQPPAIANREAPAFRIENFGFVPNGAQMRALLARGEVVILGVRTNPVFSGGRYDIYDTAAHERGRALRAPGQPHGFHAMCVAGYDDARQAFLILNSWGSDWGQNGAIWVHYDVAETFNLSESTEHLIDYGLVMFDSRSVLERTDGVWKPLDVDRIELILRSRFIGIDEAGERIFHHYFELGGRRLTHDDLASTRWELLVVGETAQEGVLVGAYGRGMNNSCRSKAASGQFRVTFETTDGRSREITKDFEFDLDSLRQVSLSQHDAYFGARLDGGGHAWRWSMVPRMSARDWTDLASIDWNLVKEDGTSGLRTTYRHDGSSAPDLGIDSKAIYSHVDPAPRSGSALLRFKDGSSLNIRFPEEPFQSPVLDGPTLTVTSRAEGLFHGQTWHHFDAQLLYPESWRGIADSASFLVSGLRLDGGLCNFDGERTRWPSQSGFAISGYAAETLNVDADLQLRFAFGPDLDFVDLDTLFQKNDTGWRSFVKRSADDVDLDLGTEEVTFSWRDRYIGLVDGVPTWEVTQFLRDLSDHSYGLPTYDWPDDVVHQESKRPRNVFCEAAEVVHATGAYEVQVRRADYHDENEAEVTHSASVSPRSPRTNAISLDVRRGIADVMTPAPGRAAVEMATVDVRGPLQRLNRVSALTLYAPSLAGGTQNARGSRQNAMPQGRDDLMRGRIPAPTDDTPVRARLDFFDGASMLVESTARGFTPYPLSAPLALEALERPWAIEDGLPTWVACVQVTGHHERREEIESVTLVGVDERGRRRDLAVDPETWTAEILTSVPLRIEARVTFDDSTGRPPETFVAHATLESQHTTEPLELFTLLDDEDTPYVDPNAWDINEGASEPVMHAVTALRGWERDLRRVRSVQFTVADQEAMEFVDDYEPETRDVTERDAESIGSFGTPYSFVYPAFVFGAKVTLEGTDDPTSLAPLETKDETFFRSEPGARSSIARFGTAEDGSPTWLLRLDSARHHYARIANHLEYKVAGAPLFPLAMLAPEASPWAITGPNDAGFFSVATQIHPGYPAEALVTTAPTRGFTNCESYQSYGWREVPKLGASGVKFPEERMAKLPEDPGPDALRILVTPPPGAASDALNRISLEGPLGLTANAARARYTAIRDGETITLEPFALHGFGHGRFDVLLEGAAPDEIRCELLRPDGEVLSTVDGTR